mmetsp:Transcript_126857/g.224824  ORF Transcript_126857/g.224824 Transcript_126857/m.224824 type:complete len:451 (+) Transcript_126857:56-1408(+)
MVEAGSESAAKRQKTSEDVESSADVWELILSNAHLATMSEKCSDRPYGRWAGKEGELSALAVSSGKIVWMGSMDELKSEPRAKDVKTHDLGGCWVTPGLIDCHTHIIYGGNRAAEWELKLKGASYEEIAKAGGGIVNTVDGTRAASVSELVESARPRIEALLAEGVTALEIKSGYGLREADERKQLEAARQVGRLFDVEVRATFLGAHAVPREYKERGPNGTEEYLDEVVRMMPVLKSEGLVDTVDAFHETIAFSAAQTERVFAAAQRLGLPVRLHGDQLHDNGGGALCAKMSALSCDHCEYTSEAGVAAMAKAGTVAVLLPTSNYFMKEKKKPLVAEMRAAGVPMALATNCNPGSSPCSSILLTLNMGCTLLGLTPEEALRGATLYAARAMGLGATHGSLEVGKVADLAVWNVQTPGELAYFMGLNKLKACYRGGRLRKQASSAVASQL